MDGGNPQSIMTEASNVPAGAQRRRSPRLASPPQQANSNKMALGFAAVKRSINVRKIAPRKTAAPSEHDKENTPRRSGSADVVRQKKQKVSTPTGTAVQVHRASSSSSSSSSSGKEKKKVSTPTVTTVRDHRASSSPSSSSSSSGKEKKQKVSTPTVTALRDHQASSSSSSSSSSGKEKKQRVCTPTVTAVQDHRASSSSSSSSSSSGKEKKPKAAMPSPILPSTPPPSAQPDPEDSVWSHKVRRSYSRLGDRSLSSPGGREALFGFDRLQTPEVIREPKTALEVSGALPGLNSFTSLLEADDCGSGALPQPDLNIPGVAVVKEKRRRKKVQQIDSTELDVLAARMNAEFEEAEEFELLVE